MSLQTNSLTSAENFQLELKKVDAYETHTTIRFIVSIIAICVCVSFISSCTGKVFEAKTKGVAAVEIAETVSRK
jgi:hypothetical protein